jgi:hypothetical protein
MADAAEERIRAAMYAASKGSRPGPAEIGELLRFFHERSLHGVAAGLCALLGELRGTGAELPDGRDQRDAMNEWVNTYPAEHFKHVEKWVAGWDAAIAAVKARGGER